MKFRLTISGDDEKGFADCFLVRNFEMPNLPRTGEYVHLGSDSYQVDAVYHYLKDGIAEVRIRRLHLWELCDAFLMYQEDWKILGFSDRECKKKFYQCLKERRKHHTKKRTD